MFVLMERGRRGNLYLQMFLNSDSTSQQQPLQVLTDSPGQPSAGGPQVSTLGPLNFPGPAAASGLKALVHVGKPGHLGLMG